MSQEDIRSTNSPVPESITSKDCNGHSLIQDQDQDQDLDNKSQSQDGIVLERIASLSLDMFDPSDFMGRFAKIQSRSRKRRRIIGGRSSSVLNFLFIRVSMAREYKERIIHNYARSQWHAAFRFCNDPRSVWMWMKVSEWKWKMADWTSSCNNDLHLSNCNVGWIFI